MRSYFWWKTAQVSVWTDLGERSTPCWGQVFPRTLKSRTLRGLGSAVWAFVFSFYTASITETPKLCLYFSMVCFVVNMSPWWSFCVWQKWIRAWPAVATTRSPLPLPHLMLERTVALSLELGLNTSHRKETTMEKNPNSNKVPPRSSSTGPAAGESKPKTGEH